jgi:hypothetical protein
MGIVERSECNCLRWLIANRRVRVGDGKEFGDLERVL